MKKFMGFPEKTFEFDTLDRFEKAVWNKSRLQTILDIEKEIKGWRVCPRRGMKVLQADLKVCGHRTTSVVQCVGDKDYIAGYEEFRDSLLLDLLKDMKEELE
jgi:hypothetical protein